VFLFCYVEVFVQPFDHQMDPDRSDEHFRLENLFLDNCVVVQGLLAAVAEVFPFIYLGQRALPPYHVELVFELPDVFEIGVLHVVPIEKLNVANLVDLARQSYILLHMVDTRRRWQELIKCRNRLFQNLKRIFAHMSRPNLSFVCTISSFFLGILILVSQKPHVILSPSTIRAAIQE